MLAIAANKETYRLVKTMACINETIHRNFASRNGRDFNQRHHVLNSVVDQVIQSTLYVKFAKFQWMSAVKFEILGIFYCRHSLEPTSNATSHLLRFHSCRCRWRPSVSLFVQCFLCGQQGHPGSSSHQIRHFPRPVPWDGVYFVQQTKNKSPHVRCFCL